jgi:chaperonin GroEL
MRELRRELLNDKDKVVEAINKSATKVKDLDDLKKIATISIGKEDEETAHKVAETVWNLARGESGEYKDAQIDVTEGYKGEIEIEENYGMRFPAKLAHRAFINKPERFEMEAEDVRVLITNYRLDNPQEIVQTLNNLQVPKVAIFAPHFSLPVIQTLINTTKNGLFCYPVLCPALRTEILEDLATYTGAVIIDKDSGRRLDTATMDNLGFADKITTRDVESKEDAVLMGGKGEKLKRSDGNKVTKRIETLKKQLPETKNEMSRVQLEKRIANLQAAMGVIRVGASTNAELLFLKLKIEDGVYACKAALQEGYVKGGGLCLKEIAEKMSKSKLYKALQEPYAQIQRNAGGLLKIEDDVIDPAKVVRLEVEHAVSVASSMITTGIIVPERRNRTEYEGNMQIAKAVAKSAYYTAKHHNLLQESEDEAEADREKAFEQALFDADKD